ncbi:MAG TPA: hypothetical protein VFI94_12550 [Pseudolabrys sp.]|nr:hypothetical protein [Pseudolabrys sp.]
MSRLIVRAAAAALCALSLTGCVDSDGPILTDAEPLFGTVIRLQFYTLRKGFADEPEQASFKWDGERYVHADGGMTDVTAFTVHRFEGRAYIVQSVAAKRPNIIEYAVAHKLAEGVYQVTAIDQDDADGVTRKRYCKQVDESYCRIAERKELIAFARATDARQKSEGGLVLRLADDASGPPR